MKLSKLLSLFLSGILLALVACSTAGATAPQQPTNTAAPTTVPTAATYTDPFAYCAAVGTIDTPDAAYTGPKMPDVLAEGLKKASGAAADAPLDLFTTNSFWRCMGGQVYGCFVGANLPCTSKANTDKTPTAAEQDFCTANPSSDVIPAVVTGHDTVYDWRCNNGVPEAGNQVLQVDGQGYIANFWYLIPSN